MMKKIGEIMAICLVVLLMGGSVMAQEKQLEEKRLAEKQLAEETYQKELLTKVKEVLKSGNKIHITAVEVQPLQPKEIEKYKISENDADILIEALDWEEGAVIGWSTPTSEEFVIQVCEKEGSGYAPKYLLKVKE